MTAGLRGLYAITDDRRAGPDALCATVAAALRGGTRLVQYRDKGSDRERRRAEAAALVALCRQRAVPLLINDDIDLALAVGADGVHLGRHDAPLGEARDRLGASRIIGVSCYNRFELARDAAAAGADYVAFGTFYPSPTKPDAVPADLELLHRTRRELDLPTVAIGGITPENGAALVGAGADMLAVISAVFAAADVSAAARAFASCFNPAEETQS